MAAKKKAVVKAKKVKAVAKAPPAKVKKAAAPVKLSKAKTKVASRSVIAPVKTAKGSGAKSNPVPVATAKAASKAAPKVRGGSGLKKAELDHFLELLLEKRREILGDVGSMEDEAFKAGSNLSNMPIHMADVGTDNFEQEFTLGMIESERQILREIQEALGRIEDGTFGICVGTGKPIGRVRLEAVPWTKYTIEYSRMLEQGLVRRDAEAGQDEAAGGEEDEE